MTKWQKIVVILINLSIGLFTAYSYLLYVRETKIQNTQDNIACNIIELHLEHSSRQHPTAVIVYRNKEYHTGINLGDSLQLGENNTIFYYDELLDRVFCRNSGIERGLIVIVVIFVLSFLFWLAPNNGDKKMKRH